MNWIKCSAYTPDKHPIWVNLDRILLIRGHENGSVLVADAVDSNGDALEYAVWDTPDNILKQARGGK